MRALLDVNVLIALLDVDHAFHPRATAWLRTNVRDGWASCPITQNGCVRIDATRVHGPRQLTDVSQLALAVKHRGRMVTFDASIAIGAVKGAKAPHLLQL